VRVTGGIGRMPQALNCIDGKNQMPAYIDSNIISCDNVNIRLVKKLVDFKCIWYSRYWISHCDGWVKF